MKNYLLLLFTIGMFATTHAQDLSQQTTDENGKTFFNDINQLNSILEKEGQRPMAIELDWTNDDFNVSDNELVDSWNPRMSVTLDGTVHVVYNDNHSNGLQKILYRKKSPSGDWSTPIFVDKGGEIGGRNNHFPSVSASENGDVHVTYNVWAFENVRNYVAYSYYNAATDTWNDGVKVSDLNGTVNHTSGRHDVFTTADDLPVAVWGYDYRENQTNEEIYMSYFDGTDWSSDIAVSDVNDGFNAGTPYVESLGDGRTMILFSEDITGNEKVLGYRIYDETTHELTDFKTLPITNSTGLNYSIATSPNNDLVVLTMHSETAPLRAAFTIYNYDSAADLFEATSPLEIDATAGNIKRIDLDCNEDGDCGIVFTDAVADNNMFMTYNETDGYSTPLEINSEDISFIGPSCEFDEDGNLHVVWNDKRFDNGSGFDEREVFYEMGVNTLIGVDSFDNNSLVIYPNPAKGDLNIQTQDNYSLKIFDLLGRTISTQEISGPTTIKSINTPGTYLFQFTGENTVFVKKVIFQ